MRATGRSGPLGDAPTVMRARAADVRLLPAASCNSREGKSVHQAFLQIPAQSALQPCGRDGIGSAPSHNRARAPFTTKWLGLHHDLTSTVRTDSSPAPLP